MNNSKNQQAKNWCFTLPNYTDDDVERIKKITCKCMVVGKEVCPTTKTPHLQGFIQFEKVKRRSQVQAMIKENVHCSVARDVEASIEYCKKEGEFFEKGSASKQGKKGKRNDLEEFKIAVKAGELNVKVLRENYSKVAAKYPRFFIDFIHDNQPELQPEEFEYREWQKILAEKLDGEPDPRKIIFIVDYDGNEGKTWFTHHYSTKGNKTCQVMIPGKKSDMAYNLIANPDVVFFDCPRSKQGEFVQYDFLEEVKNGYVFSPKYESRMKRFKTPHVVVMMNEMPDESKLSKDRFDISILN
jgi:hypothetical protein